MSGKGSNRRRENTAAVEANWDRVFGKHDAVSSSGKALASKAKDERSIRSTAAIHVDDATG